VSEAWDDEGFGGEDDWAEDSIETGLEEEEPLSLEGLEDDADSWEAEPEDEQ